MKEFINLNEIKYDFNPIFRDIKYFSVYNYDSYIKSIDSINKFIDLYYLLQYNPYLIGMKYDILQNYKSDALNYLNSISSSFDVSEDPFFYKTIEKLYNILTFYEKKIIKLNNDLFTSRKINITSKFIDESGVKPFNSLDGHFNIF